MIFYVNNNNKNDITGNGSNLGINGDKVLESEDENQQPKKPSKTKPIGSTNKKKSLVGSISNATLPPIPIALSNGATPPRHKERALYPNLTGEKDK